MTLEQFVSRLKYDRNVPRNRLKSWFMYFGFRIKILKGNPCAGLLFEIVHTTDLTQWYTIQESEADNSQSTTHRTNIQDTLKPPRY